MNVWIYHDKDFLPFTSFAVFKNILGETILIDDLDSGNCYRRAVSDACGWSCATY